MIPFFDELVRVTAPGGIVAVAYSRGAQTPIWVPLERVRAELERRGLAHVENFAVGPGLSLLARKDDIPSGYTFARGEVAQLVEHTAENRGVAGSSPALAIIARTNTPRAARGA